MADHPAQMRVDIHQHLWTEPLLAALGRRTHPPYIAPEHGLTVLHSDGELPYVIDAATAGAPLTTADPELAVIALSSPIGIETLPRAEAAPLIDAHLDGVRQAGPRFAAWGPVPLEDPDPDDVDAVLERGAIGLQLPAGALAGPSRMRAIAPLLDRATELDVPVFVHPGRAPRQRTTAACPGEPVWWRALTDYPAQMQAAYFTFVAQGRREHPGLRIVFAMLAGGAPLLAERLPLRGGPEPDLRDPNLFLDTSGYGPHAVAAVAALAGDDQLLYGSDRPVADPPRAAQDRAHQRNAARFIHAYPGVLA